MANDMGSFAAIFGIARRIARFFTPALSPTTTSASTLVAKEVEEALAGFIGVLRAPTCFAKLPLELRLKI